MNPLRQKGDINQSISNAQLLNRVIRDKRIGNQNTRRWFAQNRIEVLPKIFSDDIRLSEFISKVITRCQELGVSSTKNGIYQGPPLLDDISKLNCDAGSLRLPLHYGRKRRNVQMSSRDEELLKKVVQIATSKYDELVAGIIARDSNSGFPYFSTDDQLKHKHLAMFSENLDLFQDLFAKRDRKKLLDYLGVLNVSTTQIRRQHDKFVDGKPKYREIIDFEQSFFGDGKPIDRDLVERLSYVGGRATCRTRVVCAMPGLLNNAMSAIFEGFKDPFFKRYAKTLKHRGVDDIVEKCRDFNYFIGVDISAFDSNAPENVILKIIEFLPVSDLCKEVILDLLYNPWYLSDFNGKAVITQSFEDKEYTTFKGMPSGIFFTTWINCVQVIFYKLVEYRRFIKDIDNKVDEFLDHQLEIGSLIMSDDGIDYFKDRSIFEEIIKHGFENKYVEFEVEEAVSFLGVALYKENDVLKGCNKLTSYFEKLYLPENGVYTRYRPLPIKGMKERRIIYANHPLFEQIREIEEKCFYESFKARLAILEKEWLQDEIANRESVVGQFNDLTPIEAEVLVSPNKLHYKYNPDDVRPELRELVCRRIDLDVVNKLREKFL